MRIRLLPLVLAGAVLATAPMYSVCQQSETNPNNVVTTLAQAPKRYYKLDFVLKESNEGKLINQRTFNMSVSTDSANGHERSWWNMRAGTRLPVRDPNGTNFVDVGVNFDVAARDADNGLQLDITTDISSVATEEAAGPPPIRQVKVKAAVFSPVGKPTTVFTAEDPVSRHQFELEVTPTREK